MLPGERTLNEEFPMWPRSDPSLSMIEYESGGENSYCLE